MLGISTVVSTVLGMITWILQNFVYGLLAFFGVWTLVTALQAFRVVSRSTITEGSSVQPQSREAAAQHPVPTETESVEVERLRHENQQLREQLEKDALEAGLPPNVAVERRIANCDFRILDLLRLAGKDSVIEGKDFENCTIRGPGIIATSAPPFPPEKEHGNTAVSSTYHTPTLYVEGDPKSVLHEVPWDNESASGVIHLVGCTYRQVTFKGVGIAGSPKELEWWRENVRFSGSISTGLPRAEARIATREEEKTRRA